MAGRPSIYSEEIADKIIELISDGTPLHTIDKMDDMPCRRTILYWSKGMVDGVPEEFLHRYARAMETQAEIRFDTLSELAKDDQTDVNRSKLIVDTEKWILARQYRAKYGDRSSLDLGNQADNPLTASKEAQAAFEALSEEAREKIRKALQDEMQEGAK